MLRAEPTIFYVEDRRSTGSSPRDRLRSWAHPPPRPRAPPGLCGLCVFGIGFAVAPEVAALGSLDLHHRDPRGLQVARKLKAP